MDLPGPGAARGVLEQVVENQDQYAGAVELAPDALPIDDTRYFVASRRDRARVLLVGEGQGRPSDLFYLQAALQVVGSSVETFSVKPGELAGMALDEYDVVVVGQMAEMANAAASALEDFARNGGGILLFPGARAPLTQYGERLGTLLPAPLGDLVEVSDQDARRWAEVDTGHSVFETFAGPLAKDLTFVRTTTYVALKEPADRDATSGADESPSGSAMRVLARYDDGNPAVAEGVCGAGRVLVFTSSCDGQWSNLPLRASFVPILHRSILYLSKQKDGALVEHLVGQPLEFAFPGQSEPVSVAVTAPDGSKHVVVSEIQGGSNRAVFRDTAFPGLYTVDLSAAGTQTDETRRTMAVNVDTAEGELVRLSEREVSELLPGVNVLEAGTTEGAAVGGLRLQRGVKLTTGIIAFLVALGLMESVLASIFTSRRRSEGVRARSLDFAGEAGPARKGDAGP
jgi:hypothetical protein